MARPSTTAILVMAVGGALTIAGTLLPWVRLGERARHSYDLFALVDRLGFSDDGSAALAFRCWPLVPLLTVGAVVLAGWGRVLPGTALAVVVALYVGAVAVTVGSRGSGVADLLAGVPVTIAGTAVLVAGAVAALVTSTGHARSARRAAPPGGRS